MSSGVEDLDLTFLEIEEIIEGDGGKRNVIEAEDNNDSTDNSKELGVS